MAIGTLNRQRAVGTATGIRGWRTPHRLQAALTAICIATGIFYLCVLVTVGQLRAGIKTVGTDSAPSVVAASHMRAYLADMDANIANEMIAKPGDNLDAIDSYQKDRKDVVDNLVVAAKNITYDSEQEHIVNIAEGFAQYEELISQARSFHERGDAAMLAAYRQATDLLHKLLDEAIQLDKVNSDELEKAYAQKRIVVMALLVLVIGSGGGVLALLVVTQLYLLRNMNRVINRGLFLATVLTTLFLLMTLVRLFQANGDLKVAKEDAFDSINALWQARAIAYDINGDESRWLLDRPRAAQYEQSFFKNSDRLVKLQRGRDTDAVQAAQSQGKGADAPYLAAEINNVTFTGEREAASRMLQAYSQYFGIDSEIRQLHMSGNKEKQDRAISICIGTDPGESNWAFEQFDTALGDTLKINQDQFDLALSHGVNNVTVVGVLNPILALCVVALTIAGLRPRMQEYAL
jgi:hypothetical protein